MGLRVNVGTNKWQTWFDYNIIWYQNVTSIFCSYCVQKILHKNLATLAVKSVYCNTEQIIIMNTWYRLKDGRLK